MWEWVVLGGGVVVVAAIAAGVVGALDRREGRRVREFSTPEAFWHDYLTRPPASPDRRVGHWFVVRARVADYCKNCFAPFAGPVAPLLRPLGHGPSALNPQLCRRCQAHVPLGGAEVEITVLFADLRGSTALAEQLPAREFSALLNRFYQAAVPVLVRHGALVDKLIGDQVMALFVPALAGREHAGRALEAGAEILRSAPPETSVGIGVNTGSAYVGVLGMSKAVTDFTAVGDTVNIAARLAAEAGPGELLYTDRTAAIGVGPASTERSPQRMTVRGRREAVAVYSLREHASPTGSPGKRTRPRQGSGPRFGWGNLTDTERDVAGLVAEGFTNRDIAGRLFMSPYTVDTHLRHLFAKLQVRSRAALAAEVARQRSGHVEPVGDAPAALGP